MRGNSELSDADIVGETLAGDRRAFEALVHRHGRVAYAVAFSQLRNHADAQDAAQEAFLRAYRDLHRLREPDRFRPWLVSIARHIGLNQVRKRQREAELPGPERRQMSDLRDEIQGRERERLVHSQVHKLAPEYCEVLTLHYFAGLPTREISGALGISRESVKKRLQRARAALSAEEIKAALEPAERREDERRRRIMAAVLALPMAREAEASAAAAAVDGIAPAATAGQGLEAALVGAPLAVKVILALVCAGAVIGVAWWLVLGKAAVAPGPAGLDAVPAEQVGTLTAPVVEPSATAQGDERPGRAISEGAGADQEQGSAALPLTREAESAARGKTSKKGL